MWTMHQSKQNDCNNVVFVLLALRWYLFSFTSILTFLKHVSQGGMKVSSIVLCVSQINITNTI